MLTRDGYPESALSKLEGLYSSGNHEPRILAQLYNLRLQLGRLLDAEQALTEYLNARPLDQRANELLAALYVDTNQTGKAIEVYQKLSELHPSETKYIKALLTLFRKSRLHDRELQVLIRTDANLLDAEELYRLGLLLTEVRDFNSAISALTQADKKAPLRENGPQYEKELRMALFNMLLETSQKEHAITLAAKWSAVWKSKYHFQTFAKRLVRVAPDLVLEFARLTLPEVEGAEHWLADVLVGETRPDLLTELLRQWAGQIADASPKSIQDFIYFASVSSDPSLPLKIIDELLEKNAKPELIASLADETSKQGGMQVFSSLRGQLPYGVLRANPLFGARFFYATGNMLLARDLALNLNPQTLREKELVEWQTLLTLIVGREAAFDHLATMKETGGLSEEAYATIASLETSSSYEDPRNSSSSSDGRHF